jgi:hypothetical protein
VVTYQLNSSSASLLALSSAFNIFVSQAAQLAQPLVLAKESGGKAQEGFSGELLLKRMESSTSSLGMTGKYIREKKQFIEVLIFPKGCYLGFRN